MPMNKFTDTSEKGFQKYIVKELVEQNKFCVISLPCIPDVTKPEAELAKTL